MLCSMERADRHLWILLKLFIHIFRRIISRISSATGNFTCFIFILQYLHTYSTSKMCFMLKICVIVYCLQITITQKHVSYCLQILQYNSASHHNSNIWHSYLQSSILCTKWFAIDDCSSPFFYTLWILVCSVCSS